MDKKTSIIIFLIAILLIAIIGTVYITHAKDSSMTVLGGSTFNNNDNFTILLTDIDGNPLVNKSVSVDIIDNNGQHLIYNLTTDENGTAGFIINLTEGNYTFNCTFKGDVDFKSTFITEDITIVAIQSSSSDSNTIDDPGATYDWGTGTGWHYTGEINYDPRSESYWRHDGYGHWTRL